MARDPRQLRGISEKLVERMDERRSNVQQASRRAAPTANSTHSYLTDKTKSEPEQTNVQTLMANSF